MTLARAQRGGAALALASAAGIAAGLVVSPERTWIGILLASYALLGVGLGGLFFVALNYAAGATWAVALRRVPEAMAFAVPVGAAGMGAVFAFRASLFPWMAGGGHFTGFKATWLDPPFFFLRAGLYVVLWLAFAAAIVRTSRAQDRTGRPELTRRNIALSVGFVVAFALSFWLASFDWIMSLEPHWYSTIFGVYNFAGLFSSALAVLILLVLWLRGNGVLRDFATEDHLHDLGKLLFAFSTFWMYIWFSQYMLMWYSNIPEEAIHYVRRRTGLWLTLFYLNVALNWVVPFVVLLSRGAKRGRLLGIAAVVVLMGRVVDLYLMIYPPLVAGEPSLTLWDVMPLAGAAGVFVLVFARAFASAPPVPLKDPGLGASLHYQT